MTHFFTYSPKNMFDHSEGGGKDPVPLWGTAHVHSVVGAEPGLVPLLAEAEPVNDQQDHVTAETLSAGHR